MARSCIYRSPRALTGPRTEPAGLKDGTYWGRNVQRVCFQDEVQIFRSRRGSVLGRVPAPTPVPGEPRSSAGWGGGWAHQGRDPRSVSPRLGRLCSEALARLGGARPAVFGRTGLA